MFELAPRLLVKPADRWDLACVVALVEEIPRFDATGSLALSAAGALGRYHGVLALSIPCYVSLTTIVHTTVLYLRYFMVGGH